MLREHYSILLPHVESIRSAFLKMKKGHTSRNCGAYFLSAPSFGIDPIQLILKVADVMKEAGGSLDHAHLLCPLFAVPELHLVSALRQEPCPGDEDQTKREHLYLFTESETDPHLEHFKRTPVKCAWF